MLACPRCEGRLELLATLEDPAVVRRILTHVGLPAEPVARRRRDAPRSAAWAAIKVKDSCLQAQYVRLKARRGPKKAIVAVAASMLVAAYHILRDGTDYRDLGGAYFDRRDQRRVAARRVRRLSQLGYAVEIRPAA